MVKLNSVIVKFVLKMKEIVILMMSVKMVFSVDQTIVQLHLVLTQNLIAVINQLLAMNIFVHLECLVEKMKEIVIKVSGAKGLLVTRPPIFFWFLKWTSSFLKSLICACLVWNSLSSMLCQKLCKLLIHFVIQLVNVS